MLRLLAALFATTALGLLGCGPLDDALASTQLALDGNQAATALARSAYLGGVVFSSVTSNDAVKAAAGGALPTDLSPPGCATWTVDPADAHAASVAFEQCGGAYELAAMNGALFARFAQQQDGRLRAQIVSRDFSTSAEPAELASVAIIRIDGGSRKVEWEGSWKSGSTAATRVTQTSTMALSVDNATGCRSLAGGAKTMVDGREVDTTTDSFRLCTAKSGATLCPRGSLLHRDPASGREVAVRFDGTPRASVEPSGGDPYIVTVKCTVMAAPPRAAPAGGSDAACPVDGGPCASLGAGAR